jgi:hypothetical protein
VGAKRAKRANGGARYGDELRRFSVEKVWKSTIFTLFAKQIGLLAASAFSLQCGGGKHSVFSLAAPLGEVGVRRGRDEAPRSSHDDAAVFFFSGFWINFPQPDVS